MNKEQKKDVLNRMSYISGHLEGVKKMIEDDRYCIDIINQNKGVISALERVSKMVLRNHLNTCFVKAVKETDEKEKEKKLEELLEILMNSKD